MSVIWPVTCAYEWNVHQQQSQGQSTMMEESEIVRSYIVDIVTATTYNTFNVLLSCV